MSDNHSKMIAMKNYLLDLFRMKKRSGIGGHFIDSSLLPGTCACSP